MTETSICPAEVMAKAAWETAFMAKWEEAEADSRKNLMVEMRAALRALAEMDPTEGMIADAYEAANRASFYRGDGPDTALMAGAKAYILAAASEGEDS